MLKVPKLESLRANLTPAPLSTSILNKTEMKSFKNEYTPQNFSFYGSNNHFVASSHRLRKNFSTSLSQSEFKSSDTELKNQMRGHI